MSILDHVVYAKDKKAKQLKKEPTNKNPTHLSTPVLDKPKKVEVIKPPVKPRVVAPESNPLRFKKMPGEKEQLKDLRKEYRDKMRTNDLLLTNKQISKIFDNKITITQ